MMISPDRQNPTDLKRRKSKYRQKTNIDKCRQIYTNTDKYRQIQTNVDKYRQIQTNIDKYRPIQTNIDKNYRKFIDKLGQV